MRGIIDLRSAEKELEKSAKDIWIKDYVPIVMPHAYRLDKVLRRHPNNARFENKIGVPIRGIITTGDMRRLTRGFYSHLLMRPYLSLGVRIGAVSAQRSLEQLKNADKDFCVHIKKWDEVCKDLLSHIRSGNVRIVK